MDRFQGLDSLMSANNITDAITFNAYAKEILSKRESQGENLEGFEWDASQLDFTYEMAQMQYNIEVMASYVALNSPALPAGKAVAPKILTGSIPRVKYAVARGENDYRKQLIALNEIKSVAEFQNRPERVAVREFLAKQLFMTLDEIVNSFKNTLNYQVGQMKSQGKLTLTADNNPRGSIRATFSAQVPSANKMDKTWYNKATDGTITDIGDPIADIRDFIRELRYKANGYDNVAVEMNEKFFYKLLKHTAVLKAIGYGLTGIGLRYTKSNDDNAIAVAKGSNLEAQKEAFKALVECDELILNKTVCGVEKLNTTSKKYERSLIDAFSSEVILIRPTGKIGVIKNVVPLRPDAQAIVADIYGGRGIIEYMYNRDTREQRWQGELTALAVPTRPDDMYYFNVKTNVETGG